MNNSYKIVWREENEYKDVNASEHYKCMLHKLKENQAIIKNIKINNKTII